MESQEIFDETFKHFMEILQKVYFQLFLPTSYFHIFNI